MSPGGFVDLPSLALLMAANAAPVLAAGLLGERWAAPLDGGRLGRDGAPLFGAHKTWRGVAVAVAASSLVGALTGPGPGTGCLAGLLAMTGDLGSSWWKRRRGLRSGQHAPLLDQLPEGALPLLVLRQPLGLSWPEVAGTLATFAVLAALTDWWRSRHGIPAAHRRG